MADLVSHTDLANRVQTPLSELDTGRADVAIRSASGWLRSATELAAWPDPIPDDLWAWALDLAATVYENPGLLEELRVGGTSERYGSVHLRVRQILDMARSTYSGAGKPVGRFPPAAAWPDPPAVCL